jgi:hypothetical protein
LLETEAPITEAVTEPSETESADTATEPAGTEPTQAPTESTGSSEGTEYETCTNCGTGQIVPVNLTQDPCATRLEVTFQCNHCGTIVGYSYPPGNGHTYGITEDGQYEICTVCGTILGPTDIGHGGVTDETEHVHSYNSVVTAPTCTAGGYTTYTCACGDSYIGNKTPTDCHGYAIKTTVVEVTCTAEGKVKWTCEICGYSYDETVPAKGHKYETTTVAPTTEAQGYDLHTCKNCGDSYKDNYTEKLPADS